MHHISRSHLFLRTSWHHASHTSWCAMVALFHDMIHHEIEVYVEDMIARSQTEEEHLDHLHKLFDRLKLYKLRLNPNKCTFGVRSGKLLGFVVSVVPQNLPSHSSRPFSQGFSKFKLEQVHWDFPVPKLRGNWQKGRKQIKILFWQKNWRNASVLRFSSFDWPFGLFRHKLGLHPSIGIWTKASSTNILMLLR